MNEPENPALDPKVDAMRILSNNLRPDERLHLRQTEAWGMVFRAWLESDTPLQIQRRLLDHSKEDVLVWLDGKAVRLLNVQLQGEDEVDMLKELFPYPDDWEDLDDAPIPPPMREWIYETLGIDPDDE